MKKKIQDINRNHKVRVYYNGKRQKDMYQHLTKFGVFKLKVKRFIKTVFVLTVWLGVIFGIVMIAREFYPKVEYKDKEVIVDNLSEKIEELKWDVVNKVWDKERAGKLEKDALITWDPNPNNPKVEIASIGTCQFKIPTIIYYEKKLYNVDMNRYDATMLALSDSKCKDLMYDIIHKDPIGWQNWLNSCKKVDCKGRLAIINDLQ